MRKLKRPDGYIVEEFVTGTAHIFEDGKFIYHDNDPDDGDYTGRFCFHFTDGGDVIKVTRWYTRNTSPKWLLEMLDDAV